MAAPYTGNNGQCGSGKTAASAKIKTASAPCMSCWELTAQPRNGQPKPQKSTINVVVGDSCPNKDNVGVCPANPGDTNNGEQIWAGDPNRYNHLDAIPSPTYCVPGGVGTIPGGPTE